MPLWWLLCFFSSSHSERESADDSRSIAAQQRSSRIKARASKRDRKSGFTHLPFWRCIAPDTGRARCFRVAESDRHSPSPRRCVNSNSPTVVDLVLARVPPPLLTLRCARRRRGEKKSASGEISLLRHMRLCAHLSNGQAFDRRPRCF